MAIGVLMGAKIPVCAAAATRSSRLPDARAVPAHCTASYNWNPARIGDDGMGPRRVTTVHEQQNGVVA